MLFPLSNDAANSYNEQGHEYICVSEESNSLISAPYFLISFILIKLAGCPLCVWFRPEPIQPTKKKPTWKECYVLMTVHLAFNILRPFSALCPTDVDLFYSCGSDVGRFFNEWSPAICTVRAEREFEVCPGRCRGWAYSLKLSGESSQRATACHTAPGLLLFTMLMTTGIWVLWFLMGLGMTPLLYVHKHLYLWYL